MSQYLKPQSPLYHETDDAYFYPLTTADQVIMEDGSRLNNFVDNCVQKSYVDTVKEETITEANQQITDRIIYGKGKNLLKNTAISLTKTGITFTINADGSVTLNGTATNDCYFTITSGVLLPSGNYILSGCPAGGSMDSYILYASPAEGSNSIDIGNSVAFSTDGTQKYSFSIRVTSGVTVTGLTYHPMLRLASEIDDTYEPYYEGLKEVSNKLSMELLWENDSPNSDFAERKIAMTLNEGEVVEIAFSSSDSPNVRGVVGCTIIANITTCGSVDGMINYNSMREIVIATDGITFKDALNQTRTSTTVQATRVANNVLRPYKIYRIKEVS